MNTLLRTLAVVALAIVILSNRAYCASEEDIKKIITALTAEKRPAKEITWKKEKTSTGFWYQSVVQLKDRKVTIAYFPTTTSSGITSEGWIAFWWRPKTTPKELWTSSVNLSGASQGGIDPKRQKECIELESTNEWRGKEHLPYWQKDSDTMITELLAFYGATKK